MLLDSNVLIYASRVEAPEHADVRAFLSRHERRALYLSEISQVEVLGYPSLPEHQRAVLEGFFSSSTVLRITPVLGLAIDLRKARRGLRTPDALIAATALFAGLPLVTHNVRDFDWIEGLFVIDPLSSEEPA